MFSGTASTTPCGRFRFVQSLASGDGSVAEGPSVPATSVWDEVTREGPGWEWINLAGLDDVVRSPGWSAHRPTGSAPPTCIRSCASASSSTTTAWASGRLEDLVVTDELESLTDTINDTCLAANTDPYGLFLEQAAYTDPPEAMRAFVASLPSVDTSSARLRLWKHRDRSHPWEQHDRVDFISLAAPVPYCDVVLTEKRWAHLIKASRLAANYRTEVGHGVAALEALVDPAQGRR